MPTPIDPTRLAAPGMAVVQVHDEFLDAKEVETDPATYDWYKKKLSPFFERFATRSITSLTYEDGLAYKRYLMKEREWERGGRKHQGLSNTATNGHLRAAKILLAWACKPSRRVRIGLLFNPWEEVKYLVEKPRERLITDEELQSLLAQCTDGPVSGAANDFREAVLVLRHTTMRPGELRKLQWDYIRWDEHRIVFPPHVV